jgi:hypothetical protein
LSFARQRTPAVLPADAGALSGNPRRSPTGKEEREHLVLEDLRKSGRLDFPKGPVHRGEDPAGNGPDFLIENPSGRKVAIELTELFLDDARSPGEGSLRRQQEGLREKFVCVSEHAYHERAPEGRAANVSFHWLPEGFGTATLTPKLVRELAPVAADLLARRLSGSSGALVEIGPNELEAAGLGRYLVSIQGRQSPPYPDGRASRWCSSGPPFFPATLGVAPVERAMAAKEAKLGGYRTRCDEAWLVVAAAGGPSSPERVGDEVLCHNYRSAFDRVVLFCPRADPDRRVLMLV